ncbi:MFS transporter [Alkalicoccobacillus murimartini]|uniref:MFS family permease n=1 Tax=Alkalicoccobacillus murimartini TaxID=171685 RepID=A0ABT9YIZ4_9BACI|nr:MFS transporter [Alkalicoccobacillus murimartini]MDQ0207831.1 MFS family permease [Alkalicoccobacillus murimartini]
MDEGFHPLRKNRAFYWLMGGNLASFAGAQVYLVALPLIVLSLTGSAIAMGTVAAIGQATVWLQPFVGPVVDRYSRKTLLLLCDAVRAFVLMILSVLYLVDELHIFYLFIAALLIGACTQLYNTAQFAVIPSIVKKEDLQLANTIESSMFHTAILVGPTLGGLFIAFIHPGIGLIANSIGFFFAFIAVLFIQVPLHKESNIKSSGGFFRDVGKGFSFIYQKKILLLTNLSSAFISFGITISLTLLVFHLQATIGLTAIEIGWLLSIGGAAAIVGSFLSVFIRKVASNRSILFCGYLGGGLSLIWLGLAHSYTALLIANAIGTFCAASFNPVIKTLRQKVTPDHMLGRVQASSRFITMALIPLAALIAGLLGDSIGTHLTIAIGGIIASCSILIFLHSDMGNLG